MTNKKLKNTDTMYDLTSENPFNVLMPCATGKKLRLNELGFELTRRCNMNCAHCINGNAEDLDITEEIIDAALDEVQEAKEIRLFGGESLLVPNKLEYLIDAIIKRNIAVFQFSFVTNGTIRSTEARTALSRIEEYIKGNRKKYVHLEESEEYKRVGISVSVDKYHKMSDNADRDVSATIQFYKKAFHDVDFNRIKEHWWKGEESLSYSGRAIKLHDEQEQNVMVKRDTPCHLVSMNTDGKDIKCPVIICANGNVVIDGTFSYKEEDYYSLGNIQESYLADMINNWNARYPITCLQAYTQLIGETGLVNERWTLTAEKRRMITNAIKVYHELRLPFDRMLFAFAPSAQVDDAFQIMINDPTMEEIRELDMNLFGVHNAAIDYGLSVTPDYKVDAATALAAYYNPFVLGLFKKAWDNFNKAQEEPPSCENCKFKSICDTANSEKSKDCKLYQMRNVDFSPEIDEALFKKVDHKAGA